MLLFVHLALSLQEVGTEDAKNHFLIHSSDRLKKIGDRKICVVTQGVKDTNVQKNARPVVGNLLLKINAKIGGVNYVFMPDGLEVRY